MLGVWAFGIGLATSGGWFTSGWLQAKLVLVVLLSAIHGLQSGQIGRRAAGTDLKPLRALVLVVPSVIAIAVLAVIQLPPLAHSWPSGGRTSKPLQTFGTSAC